MKIKTFGKITEIVNREIDLNFPITVHEVRKKLEQEFPQLSTLKYMIAVDDHFILDDSTVLTQPTIIALLPPFSGG